MACIPREEKRTVIIPVQKTTKPSYVIEITDVVWNAIQILILEGAENKNVTVEFSYQKQEEDK